MTLSAGSTLGGYEVLSPLGSGGMGEVYRARDTKLGRSVAVKILPEAFTFDPDRVARFEREAKVLASLNHPHIAALHGMETSDSRHFLIMELVEGETLADRLRRGPLAVEEALRIATQIADALEAAHEQGVVHRDLKPANIKITPDEKVKVLDFGLAKAMEGEAVAAGNVTHSPTLSLVATQAGVILGTAAYMSPEQAKGAPADHRSDVFSFGVVLYEMLTGRQPFQGDTAPEIMASVLVRDVDLSALPPNLTPRLADLLRRCLDKQPKRRWQAIGDVRAELEAIAATPRSAPVVGTVIATPRPLWRRAAPIAGAALIGSALTAATGWYLMPSAVPPAVTRFSVLFPDGEGLSNTNRAGLGISPDGTNVAYFLAGQLYIRSMAEGVPRPLAGTGAGGTHAVFSPDGQSVAFWQGGTVKRIATSGGVAVSLAQVANPFGMSWGADGIAIGQGPGGIVRVPEAGGDPEPLVRMGGEEKAHGPQVLPGGDAVLFTLANGNGREQWNESKIVVQSIRSGERRTLIEAGTDGRYIPTGHIVYAVSGALFAVPFDVGRLEVRGRPVPMVEGVRRAPPDITGTAHFSVSATGTLVYVPGPASTAASRMDVALMDRKGGVERLQLLPGPYDYPRFSPDGTKVAFMSDDGREAIVWVYDVVAKAAIRRLTFGGNNRFPIWSPDGSRITFQSDREGRPGMFWQAADGTGAAERLTVAEQGTVHVPESWSPDGQTLLFSVQGTVDSLWRFSLRDKKVEAFAGIQSGTRITSMFSPDGRWVAYVTTERGPESIFVQPFPPTGARYQIVSSGNPHHPLWSRDGKEIFYVSRVGGLDVVRVTLQPSFGFGNPEAVPRRFPNAPPTSPRTFDIGPDGRIVGIVSAEQLQGGAAATITQIQVVLNWFEELKARVPVR